MRLDALEGDRSFGERPESEGWIGAHLFVELIVLQQVGPLARPQVREDIFPSEVDPIVEVAAEEAKVVVENHRAVPTADVGELVLAEAGDGEAGLLVEDAGQVLRDDGPAGISTDRIDGLQQF